MTGKLEGDLLTGRLDALAKSLVAGMSVAAVVTQGFERGIVLDVWTVVSRDTPAGFARKGSWQLRADEVEFRIEQRIRQLIAEFLKGTGIERVG